MMKKMIDLKKKRTMFFFCFALTSPILPGAEAKSRTPSQEVGDAELSRKLKESAEKIQHLDLQLLRAIGEAKKMFSTRMGRVESAQDILPLLDAALFIMESFPLHRDFFWESFYEFTHIKDEEGKRIEDPKKAEILIEAISLHFKPSGEEQQRRGVNRFKRGFKEFKLQYESPQDIPDEEQ